MRKKFLAIAMSAVMAISLCPGLAIAAPLTGGKADMASQPAKTVQAKKATVYVLTGTDAFTEQFTYNSNGLLTSSSGYKFAYKGVNLTGIQSTGGNDVIFTVKSKNGMPKSSTSTYKYTRGYDSETGTYKYATRKNAFTYGRDGNGNLTSVKNVDSQTYYCGKTYKKPKKIRTTTTDLTLNKKGRIVKSVDTTKSIDKSMSVSAPYKYTYDKKGNLKKITKPYQYGICTYSYAYSKKHAKSRTYRMKLADGTSYPANNAALEFKAIKVPAKFANIVKAQQWALLNGNVNCAFGPVSPGLYFEGLSSGAMS